MNAFRSGGTIGRDPPKDGDAEPPAGDLRSTGPLGLTAPRGAPPEPTACTAHSREPPAHAASGANSPDATSGALRSLGAFGRDAPEDAGSEPCVTGSADRTSGGRWRRRSPLRPAPLAAGAPAESRVQERRSPSVGVAPGGRSAPGGTENARASAGGIELERRPALRTTLARPVAAAAERRRASTPSRHLSPARLSGPSSDGEPSRASAACRLPTAHAPGAADTGKPRAPLEDADDGWRAEVPRPAAPTPSGRARRPDGGSAAEHPGSPPDRASRPGSDGAGLTAQPDRTATVARGEARRTVAEDGAAGEVDRIACGAAPGLVPGPGVPPGRRGLRPWPGVGRGALGGRRSPRSAPNTARVRPDTGDSAPVLLHPVAPDFGKPPKRVGSRRPGIPFGACADPALPVGSACAGRREESPPGRNEYRCPRSEGARAERGGSSAPTHRTSRRERRLAGAVRVTPVFRLSGVPTSYSAEPSNARPAQPRTVGMEGSTPSARSRKADDVPTHTAPGLFRAGPRRTVGTSSSAGRERGSAAASLFRPADPARRSTLTDPAAIGSGTAAAGYDPLFPPPSQEPGREPVTSIGAGAFDASAGTPPPLRAAEGAGSPYRPGSPSPASAGFANDCGPVAVGRSASRPPGPPHPRRGRPGLGTPRDRARVGTSGCALGAPASHEPVHPATAGTGAALAVRHPCPAAADTAGSDRPAPSRVSVRDRSVAVGSRFVAGSIGPAGDRRPSRPGHGRSAAPHGRETKPRRRSLAWCSCSTIAPVVAIKTPSVLPAPADRETRPPSGACGPVGAPARAADPSLPGVPNPLGPPVREPRSLPLDRGRHVASPHTPGGRPAGRSARRGIVPVPAGAALAPLSSAPILPTKGSAALRAAATAPAPRAPAPDAKSGGRP